MTETSATPSTEQPIRWEWRYVTGMLVLMFNGSLIVWLILFGRSENLLHQNGLSWAFIMSGGILGGFGLGSIIEPLSKIMGGK